MSERWQTCPTCKGRGYLIVEIPEPARSLLDGPSQTKEECGRCGGTGWGGDATAPRDR